MTKYKLWVLIFRGQAMTRCHGPVSAQGMDTILFFVSFMRDRVQVWTIIYDDGTNFFLKHLFGINIGGQVLEGDLTLTVFYPFCFVYSQLSLYKYTGMYIFIM